jgi:ABC-type nickel/cobalt efflux system permease component RcnA
VRSSNTFLQLIMQPLSNKHNETEALCSFTPCLLFQVVRCRDLGEPAAAHQQEHEQTQQTPAASAQHHHRHHHQHQQQNFHSEQHLADETAGVGRKCDKQLVVHLLHLNHSLHLPP